MSLLLNVWLQVTPVTTTIEGFAGNFMKFVGSGDKEQLVHCRITTGQHFIEYRTFIKFLTFLM